MAVGKWLSAVKFLPEQVPSNYSPPAWLLPRYVRLIDRPGRGILAVNLFKMCFKIAIAVSVSILLPIKLISHKFGTMLISAREGEDHIRVHISLHNSGVVNIPTNSSIDPEK